MVAEHEVRIGRDHNIRIRAIVLVHSRDVIFDQQLPVEINAAIHDSDMIAGDTNHALNKALLRIPRIAEDDDVATLDGLNSIDELVNENALLVIKRRHHAGALDLHRLVKENNDESRNCQGNN